MSHPDSACAKFDYSNDNSLSTDLCSIPKFLPCIVMVANIAHDYYLFFTKIVHRWHNCSIRLKGQNCTTHKKL